MPGSSTTPGGAGTRDDAPAYIAFRENDHVGTRDCFKLSRLNGWPVCSSADASPCTLAGADARLGADGDRYSFMVVDFHHLIRFDGTLFARLS